MPAILKELTIASTPESIFNALTKPEEIAHWWTDDLSVTQEVGSLAEFRFSQRTFIVQFEIVALKADEEVSWISRRGPAPHWEGTSVTWQLTPVQDGTHLVFNHDNFAQVDERYKMTLSWWEYFLTSLKSYLETGKGTPGSPLSAR